jgi:hypothetical protein
MVFCAGSGGFAMTLAVKSGPSSSPVAFPQLAVSRGTIANPAASASTTMTMRARCAVSPGAFSTAAVWTDSVMPSGIAWGVVARLCVAE